MRISALKILAPSLILGLAMTVPALAQSNAPAANTSPSASSQMKAAGENAEQMGSDAAASATDVARGTKTAVKDTAITAKVKTALHQDDQLKNAEIHVSTTAGTVTLRGYVPSLDMAAHAQQVAQQTEGVKNVNNKLKVKSENSMR